VKRIGVGLFAAALVLIGLTGCEKVKKPTSDTTPPTLTWHVENRTQNTSTDINGTGSVTGKKGDDFRVTLTAKDPQGIQKITMGGGYTKSCKKGSLGQSGQGDFAGKVQNLSPDGDGNVLTSIFLIESYTPDIDCNAGWTWEGTSIGLVGSGVNYLNLTTDGNLTIKVNP
jgi:hypothetical protein